MKNTLKRLSIATAVAVILLCVQTTSSLCRAQSLPDLSVRINRVVSPKVITVDVVNVGQAASSGCYVTLYLVNPSDKKVIFTTQGTVEPLPATNRARVDFSIGDQALAGMLVRVMVDSSRRIREANEENNWGELFVRGESKPPAPAPAPLPTPAPIRISPAPAPKPLPTPAPKEAPRLSPDLAAVKIYFENDEVIGVIQNVGDREYASIGVDQGDSFTRTVKLTREVRAGTNAYEHVVDVRKVRPLSVGKKIVYAFKAPKKVASATKYTWTLTIEGDDPNMQNNTVKYVQPVTKFDDN